MTETISYIATALIAVALTFTPGIKNYTNSVSTLFHEMGHNLALVFPTALLGGRPAGFKIFPDGNGEIGRNGLLLPGITGTRTISMFYVYFAGYVFPLLLSYIAISSYQHGHTTIIFGVVTTVTALSVLFVRNGYGLLIISIVLLYLGVGYVAPELQPLQLLLLGMLLLITGVNELFVVAGYIFRNQEVETDFHILGDELFGGAKQWFVVFLLTQLLMTPLVYLPLWEWVLTFI